MLPLPVRGMMVSQTTSGATLQRADHAGSKRVNAVQPSRDAGADMAFTEICKMCACPLLCRLSEIPEKHAVAQPKEFAAMHRASNPPDLLQVTLCTVALALRPRGLERAGLVGSGSLRRVHAFSRAAFAKATCHCKRSPSNRSRPMRCYFLLLECGVLRLHSRRRSSRLGTGKESQRRMA